MMMKKLSELIRNIESPDSGGLDDIIINSIQYDSRNIHPGDLFVAIRGDSTDGHEYINAAAGRGARAIVCERRRPGIAVPCIQVDSSRRALALMAAAYYDHPGRHMKLVGITGTNGKTSTAYLIESVLLAGGYRTGLLGTISYKTGTEEHPAPWTTPESLELQHYLSIMRENNIQAAVMEVSSHALEQHRVEGLVFDAAVFTNLSQDHLDYHRSMERYTQAKQRLFQQVDPGKGGNIINIDDPAGRLMQNQNHRPVVSFSAETGKADVFPVSAHFSENGVDAEVATPAGRLSIHSPLIGRHNLYNILAAVCTGLSMDIPLESIGHGINSMQCVPGRLEAVNTGQPFPVLVDYAHTHDAMQKVIEAVRPLVKGKLIVLFGCGGDRDRGKRPLMGQVAEKYADRAILTSDNPRTEDPQQIIDDVLKGIGDMTKFDVVVDRTEAIHKALDHAEAGDWVLILGKGHETYQVIGTERIDFDDRIIAHDYLSKKFSS